MTRHRTPTRAPRPLLALFLLPLAAAERAPFHLPTDGGNWGGNTGTWSALSVRIGTPAQYVYLLASTSTSITTTITESYCSDSSQPYPCKPDRGGGFNPSTSSTWQPADRNGSNYALPASLPLGELPPIADEGWGYYGRDTVKLKTPGEDIAIDDTVIAVLNDTTQLVGSLGLGTNTRSFKAEEEYRSYLTALYEEGVIPSRSFGYTAGNYWREQRTVIDVVLGGANRGRYDDSDMGSWPLDIDHQPSGSLEGVRMEATGNAPWGTGAHPVLAESTPVRIDSDTPWIWLPSAACEELALRLNLTYDEPRNIYTYPSPAAAEKLEALNLSFKFTIAKETGSNETVTVKLPFASMEKLRLKWPFTKLDDDGERYFPLKKTEGGMTAVLGRVFLQDAYLVVNYDLDEWSVHQARFPVGPDQLVPMLRVADTPTDPDKGGEGLGKGVVAGIVVAAIAALLLCATGAWFWFTRRKREGSSRIMSSPETHEAFARAEIDGTPKERHGSWLKPGVHLNKPEYAQEEPQYAQETDGTPRYEMASWNVSRSELPGSEVEEAQHR